MIWNCTHREFILESFPKTHLTKHHRREQGGHSGMPGMTSMKNVDNALGIMDGDGEAEQMALFATYFAPISSA